MTLQECVRLFMAGRLEEARRACRKLVATRPDLAEAHLLFAEIHRASGDEARARESASRARKLRPEWSEARLHLMTGDLYGDSGRYDDAAARYRRALELEPRLADARFNLAAALAAAGRNDECIAELTTLLAHEPTAADARQRLIVLLHAARRMDELESVAREGMALEPRESFYPRRLGVALWWRGQHDEAIALQRRAAELAGTGTPAYRDAKLLEASSLLSLGRYADGWQAYRWRESRTRLRTLHPSPVDDPATLAAPQRVRVVQEQGFGDELFFLRFAPALRSRGYRLAADCDDKLAALLASRPDLFEEIETDCTLTAADLPLVSGESFAPPLELPVDAARRAGFEARLRSFGPPPYIGVTWRAGILPDDPKPQGVYWAKEVPPEALATALRAIDVRVIVLQRRPAAEELRRFGDALGRPVLDLSAVNDDLRDALAVLSLLDDYVGMSNTNMHLRAALPGKTARVLVRMPAEWRWGIEGDRSPWFPGFKVYRLAFGEKWDRALGELARDLAKS